MTSNANTRIDLVVPGGHIEYGETILGAAVREAKVIGFGEVVNPAGFYRPGHEEISDFRWASIREAKNLELASIHRSIIEAYEKQESL